MNAKSVAERALNQGKGIVRLTPTWVPRVFCVPGRALNSTRMIIMRWVATGEELMSDGFLPRPLQIMGP